MRYLILIGAIVSTWTAMAGTNVRECQSYLLAPKGLKNLTRDLLFAETAEAMRVERQSQIRTYVTTAPTGDPGVIKYLQALQEDSVKIEHSGEHMTSFAEFLINTYLVRAGNEELALPLLGRFLSTYWETFFYGSDDTRQKDRLAQGFGWTELQTQFIQRLSRVYPDEMRAAWNEEAAKAARTMLNFPHILANFSAAQSYLQHYLSQSSAEISEDDELFEERNNTDNVFENRERLNYVRDLIAEIEAPISSHSVGALLKFYKIGHVPFPGNGTFIRDEDRWRSRSVEFTTPAHLLVYYVRLTRRLALAPPEMQTLLETIKRLKDGLRQYPRPVQAAL